MNRTANPGGVHVDYVQIVQTDPPPTIAGELAGRLTMIADPKRRWCAGPLRRRGDSNLTADYLAPGRNKTGSVVHSLSPEAVSVHPAAANGHAPETGAEAALAPPGDRPPYIPVPGAGDTDVQKRRLQHYLGRLEAEHPNLTGRDRAPGSSSTATARHAGRHGRSRQPAPRPGRS